MWTDEERALLRDALAEYAHEAWAGWMKYLFSKCEPSKRPTFAGDYTMPAWAVERWQRQMNTPYADLPESEKESDRAEADKMLALVQLAPQADTVQPDWSTLPDVVRWWCVNANGLVGVSDDREPVAQEGWSVWTHTIGLVEKDGAPVRVNLPLGIDWRTTLRRRPLPASEAQPAPPP